MDRLLRPRMLIAVVAAGVAMGLGIVVAPATSAASDDTGSASDVRQLPAGTLDNRKLPLDKSAASVNRQFPDADARAIGQSVPWLALDDVQGRYYLKNYTLRGVGDHIEVWVADDRAFPTANDCRNQLNLTDVTDRQVNTFIDEFDDTILPKESQVFSVAPGRNGSHATLPGLVGLPTDTYVGAAGHTVALVDNVRDANYYTPRASDGHTFIAGFFSSTISSYVDRNVMTIDAFDWLHRTGANPPDDSTDPAYVACATYLQRAGLGTPNPHGYEGVFAHEYQHLLESYADPDEVSWVNEGLSDWAQYLVGYADPSLLPTNPKLNNHLRSFMGYLGEGFGGPENSLTSWQDQGASEILSDYGAAWSMMQYLSSHYGKDFMTFLHRDDRNGLASLDADLQQSGIHKDAREVLHDWAAAIAVDWQLDTSSGQGNGQYQASTLAARVNWQNPQAYSTPGAPPNGSDYVRLRGAGGNFLGASDINRISFKGAASLEPDPLEWAVDRTPPTGITASSSCGTPPAGGSGAAALYSGCGDSFDRAAVRAVSVPASDPTLSFDALWGTEVGWDFGYVQVSTDGGKTYTSLSTASTTTAHDPGAIPAVVANLPGFNGTSAGWVAQQADLRPYAGKTVLLSFRYITDPSVSGAGMWVRNVKVGESTVPTSTVDGWRSLTQVQPVAVSGYTVQLVSYNPDGGPVKVSRLPLDGQFASAVSGAQLARLVDPTANVVAAVVMYDEPTEQLAKQARYTLQVNQAVQPGG